MSTLTGKVYPWQEGKLDFMSDMHRAGRLAHAYLLGGSQYLGKLDFALSFASYMLCEKPENNLPCNNCGSCNLVIAGSHSDLKIIEPVESKQIRIEQIRELVNWSAQTSLRGGHKVVVLYPAEQMNRSTANAFLKCLEEPPDKTLLLLVSNQPNRLLATIRSRCQQVLFQLPDKNTSLQWLGKELDEKDSFEILLSMAKGLPLKVTRLFTKDYLVQRQDLIKCLAELVRGEREIFQIASSLKDFDEQEILVIWLDFLSDCVRYNYQSEHGRKEFDAETTNIIRTLISELGIETLFKFLDRLNHDYAMLKGSTNLNPTLNLESLLIDWSERSYASSGKRG